MKKKKKKSQKHPTKAAQPSQNKANKTWILTD